MYLWSLFLLRPDARRFLEIGGRGRLTKVCFSQLRVNFNGVTTYINFAFSK